MARKLDYNASVTQRIELAPGLFIIRVVPDGPLFEFKAGQYTVLGRKLREIRATGDDADEWRDKDPDQMVRRAYSIASGSVERDYIEFYIVLVEDGTLTPRLFNLQIGDRLFLGPKATGQFTLESVPAHKHVLMIATGTGVAPFVSFTRTHFECNSPRVFAVAHGVRHVWDFGYQHEFAAVSRLCKNFVYIPAITRPSEIAPWNGLQGRIPALVESGAIEKRLPVPLAPDAYHVFLCGHPEMIQSVTAYLEQRGFEKDERNRPGQIHTEEYW